MYFCATNSSTVLTFDKATILATFSTRALNSSFAATKSVSQLTSTTEPNFISSEMYVVTIPSAAILPAFLAAAASPFSLNTSIALSMSPLVSLRAFLQSIIPAPVLSLSSLTIPAVIIFIPPLYN
ncbi:hypothetical protein SDC9_71377 [bioreactor metagenome]|uniref:Uncharacterized protein n=1 Tax=bioreactor metagenome TaxID=1076179 RepID=A0A644Y999_9ZZZZ